MPVWQAASSAFDSGVTADRHVTTLEVFTTRRVSSWNLLYWSVRVSCTCPKVSSSPKAIFSDNPDTLQFCIHTIRICEYFSLLLVSSPNVSYDQTEEGRNFRVQSNTCPFSASVMDRDFKVTITYAVFDEPPASAKSHRCLHIASVGRGSFLFRKVLEGRG